MEIELGTKDINLQYLLHKKKLKKLFVEGLSWYSYKEFFFEVYIDGHRENDPYHYRYSIDEATGQVIYDYTEEKYLSFDEKISLLESMKLDKTKLRVHIKLRN